MSRKEKTLRETIEEVYDEIVNYANEFANESDRAAAVLAAALFEESLREAIVKRFVEVDKKTADRFRHLPTDLLLQRQDQHCFSSRTI